MIRHAPGWGMAAGIVLATMGCGVIGESSVSDADRHRGVKCAHARRDGSTLGYASPASQQSIHRFRSVHVNWIALTPFGFQRTPRDTEIRWGGARFSESECTRQRPSC